MDVKRTGTVLAGAAVLALTVAAFAVAAPGENVLWQGVTSEGVTVKYTVTSSGDPHAFKIGKTESECTGGGTLSSQAVTYRDFDIANEGHFRDKRKTMSDRGPYHFHVTSRLHGRLDDEPHSWSGSYKLHTRVFKHDEDFETCELQTRWSVGRVTTGGR